MKKLLILCSFLLIFSCNSNIKKKQKPTFLIGEWKRLNDKPGSQTYEIWNTNLVGMGYTMKGKTRSFQEILSIITIKDTLYLEVKGVNEKPTLFKFIEQTDTSFVSENPKNEFPNRIKYILDNKQLKASVSSDDFRIDFIFDKVN
ncbi:hypothetical protein KO506_04390 [Polaribacter vadi]|uniref:DUF6265 family protein n=1 Tax=Polaribacter TaxID=52959 RepID=UPI001C08BE50|nr:MULTISPECIES: DUF6265 family protein [Polaribacter]MBU3010627.1 hypothetical protein [Polaribacter vadi]MDO6740438.1 DUF6265 family protein [Polaribacter sp. 1_MG-2023]